MPSLRLWLFAAASLALSMPSWAASSTVPTGFDDPGLMDSLRKGKIHQKDLLSTSNEMRVLFRSLFVDTTAADFVDIIEDHDHYNKIFSKIKDSQRLKTYTSGRKFAYEVTMDTATPIGSMTIQPQLLQEIDLATDPDKESTVTDTVTNYTKDVDQAGLSTRLVPFEKGLLVATTVHIKLKSGFLVTTAKSQLRQTFKDMVQELRDALKANP